MYPRIPDNCIRQTSTKRYMNVHLISVYQTEDANYFDK